MVFACSQLRLTTMPITISMLEKASVSMAENIMLKSVGTRKQPCLTPLETENGSEDSPLSWTLACIPRCSCRTIVLNLVGHPYFAMIPQRPSPLTVSKWYAPVLSMNEFNLLSSNVYTSIFVC